MPGTTTHTYVMYKAMQGFTPKSDLFKKVKESFDRCEELAKEKKGYEKFKKDEKSLLASCGYMGCFGPDLFYMEYDLNAAFIADLMHYNKTSLFTIDIIRKVKHKQSFIKAGKYSNHLRQFAYALGHISHIAADIITHPYVNSIVESYPDNEEKIFEDSQGINGKNTWRFHNKLEHFQDSYVLHRLFFGQENFYANWSSANATITSAYYYLKGKNKQQWFLMDNARSFYGFTKTFKAEAEKEKYKFFYSSNWIVDISKYYQYVVPKETEMNNCDRLVQGGIFSDTGKLTKKGTFDKYLDRAINQTRKFWNEVDIYMEREQSDFSDPQYTEEKKIFKTLKLHWNLDGGLYPQFKGNSKRQTIDKEKQVYYAHAGELQYKSVHKTSMPDTNGS